ncbi:uncharacterized protein LOC133645678 isoform X1 [Entelurus aequoreus]|uniref:uncharacterized protein LOC133645415 isoform X1 n=1 Tax=Entelurus aequoreus TaxID=161455 RepID=UPI002B1E2C19|nr:uncharacterized protein LOC133645415 isoform X1 [Entelurus aequoreus]XP_061896227.1 uncharacterized protein LOC133645415 isoform X1 [Entelurus aequoreus]XP_061896237.1 uncharacterized protein LOC133645415 isoform X1 [Entelurus aequoreus]XP_061896518.1 uncharacterized protein LOC133645678 isoform X1 [Entelurus aequoreus]XP_061896519.1 uncharacterized protein LOC133645678 isoform X1 [Entelurus aequoreus]
MVCLKLSSLTRALNSRKRVMEVIPNNMVRLETLDGKPKHMMTPYASLKPLRPRTHPGWPKDSPSAPVLPGDAEMLTSSSEEETECHCFTDHTYAGPASPWKKELHPDQKQLLEYVLACDRPAMELIVKEGGVCLTREEFWSLGLSRDMDSTDGKCLPPAGSGSCSETWQRCLHCQHVYCTNVEAQRRRSNVKPSKGCTSKGCTPLPSVEQAQHYLLCLELQAPLLTPLLAACSDTPLLVLSTTRPHSNKPASNQ